METNKAAVGEEQWPSKVGVFLWSDKHRAGNLSILLFNPIGLLSQD
jgi:hypothetical protein